MAKATEDNAYPNDGRFFSPFAEVDVMDSETKQAEANADVLKELVGYFDERIEFYGSVDSVSDESQKNPEVFMHIISSNKLTRNNLIQIRNYVSTLLESIPRG